MKKTFLYQLTFLFIFHSLAIGKEKKFFRNDALACGLRGTVDERIESCALKIGPQGAIRWYKGLSEDSEEQVFPWRLVSRTPSGHEVWINELREPRSGKRLLWIEGTSRKYSFEIGDQICRSPYFLPHFKAGLPVKFRLPYYWELKHAVSSGLSLAFPDTHNYSFWTQSTARDTWRESWSPFVQKSSDPYYLVISLIEEEGRLKTSWMGSPASETHSVKCVAAVP